MNVQELKRLLEEQPEVLEHILRTVGPVIEGQLWEHQAAKELEKLGFTNIIRHEHWHAYYDYEADRDNQHFLINVKLHGKQILKSLSLESREHMRLFMEHNGEHFLILSKELGLVKLDERTKRRLLKRPKTEEDAHVPRDIASRIVPWP